MIEFVKKYEPKHYSNNMNKVDNYFHENGDISDGVNSFVKKLSLSDLRSMNKSMRYLIRNNELYFNESTILMTMIIRLFIIELDVDQDIKLTNENLERLVHRFNKILKDQINCRTLMKNEQEMNITYTLLRDTRY